MLQVDKVTKTYPSPAGPITVLADVSFTLAAGERLVVMGPSGSGKSTLLSLAGGLDVPTSGSVRLDGVEPAGLATDERAAFRNARIGFVFQDHHLLAGCTALDNVLVPLVARGRISDAMIARGRMLLDRVGLGPRAEHEPAALSGGERQRVAVARALMAGPRLILADEPTGQLDADTAVGVADVLVDLAKETGAMLVVVTHAESIAARIATGSGTQIRRLIGGRLLP